MKIRLAAEFTGLSEKTIRYYEEIGLVEPARMPNGYRDFSDQDLHKLKFLGRARELGFSVESCRQLLGLYGNDERASKDVKQIAEHHLSVIETKIAELEDMHRVLKTLIKQCKGNDRPDCPILNDLAGD